MVAMPLPLLLLLLLLPLLAASAAGPPNIVIVLTDDQDVALGGLLPMSHTRRLIAEMGVTCNNAFASVAICCPSRSSLLTGWLPHNVGVANNSVGGGCAGPRWRAEAEPNTFGARLHRDAGYRTFYAGKYLNQYGRAETGGVEHVPPGWDWWLGLVGNSRYYNFTLSVNGTATHYTDTYLTDLITSSALDFLRGARPGQPFLLVAAPPAPHAPATPAPRHAAAFPAAAAPRNPNFNVGPNADKHWLVRMSPSPLPPSFLPTLDATFRRRWQTLLAVDEMVLALVQALQRAGALDNTFFFVTSDHGYHLGQFSQPWDKRQPYESDVRVPLLVRGPGVRGGASLGAAVSLVDLAATVLDIAGIPDSQLDGPSFLPLLQNPVPGPGPGRTLLIEYQGEGEEATVDASCPLPRDDSLSQCSSEFLCKCQDARNNTYSCLRHLSERQDFLYCRFLDQQDFEEVYEHGTDPWQLSNAAAALAPGQRLRLRSALARAQACRGQRCWEVQLPSVLRA